MTPELRKMVEDEASDADMERLAREQGTQLLIEDAISKVAQGISTEEELRRVVIA